MFNSHMVLNLLSKLIRKIKNVLILTSSIIAFVKYCTYTVMEKTYLKLEALFDYILYTCT